MTTPVPRPPIAWGVSAADVAATYPSTALVPAPLGLWRGVDVAAPAATAFAWLEQLRVAPYSFDLIDNLGRRSPRTLSTELGPAQVGQRLMTIFTIVDVVPGREITACLTPSTQHVLGRTAVTYRVVPLSTDRCRIVVRLDVSTAGVTGAVVRRLLPWGDLVMMRRQLRTLARLAERNAAAERRRD